MFSESSKRKTNIINAWFISGINPLIYEQAIKDSNYEEKNLKPEILIKYPKQSIVEGYLNVSTIFLFLVDF